jgi:hypothetical protein
MMRSLLYGSFALFVLPWNTIAGADDINLPAGTLLRCTLDEPNFSSETAEEGDPVLCRTSLQSQFGRGTLARSGYLVGRLATYKDPGHFFGKGFLRLEFDRISLANADVPISAKVISVRGYRVNRQGNIIGHGHATRDAVEWALPPLWPWKTLALPARGPRPTLKGEVPVTLRLLNPVLIPDMGDSSSGRLGKQLNSSISPSFPQGRKMSLNTPGEEKRAAAANTVVLADPDSAPWTSQEPTTQEPARQEPVQLILFAMRNGTTRGAKDCWLEGGRLHFVLPDGTERSADLQDVDWGRTNQLSFARGSRIVLRNGRQQY